MDISGEQLSNLKKKKKSAMDFNKLFGERREIYNINHGES